MNPQPPDIPSDHLEADNVPGRTRIRCIFSPVAFRIAHGDLLEQPVDAIVNAWNRNLIPWWLLLPQGVSGAIKKSGGYAPFRELGYRPLPLGHARLTGAGRLPYEGIIHVAAINGLWRASEYSIRTSTKAALDMATTNGFRSLAMPILGSGSGGFPQAEAEAIMRRVLEAHEGIRVVLVRYRPSMT